MRQRICRRLFAAATVAIVLAGTASAQDRTGAPPTIPVASPVGAEAAPGPTAPTVPAASAGAVVSIPESAPTSHYRSVGTAARGFVMESGGGYFCSSCQTGQECNSGCGSLKSDCKFVFGSCRSFFSPCGPSLGGRHGGLGGRLDNCRTPVYGTGSMNGPMNPCVYDSYLNH
jgi:hypothetical protein